MSDPCRAADKKIPLASTAMFASCSRAAHLDFALATSFQTNHSCLLFGDEMYDLERFLTEQEMDYERALSEIRGGCKRGHWIWYIFPQLAALGLSETSKYYGISGIEEAREYLANETLRSRLLEISGALLSLECSDACKIMGEIDAKKLRSSMTLFAKAAPEEETFSKVLEKFFGGRKCERTLALIRHEK